MGLKLFCIDSIAPFCVHIPQNSEINWSKIPFHLLERDGCLDPEIQQSILPAFELYCATISRMGYTAITIDDLAHCVSHSFYPDSLQKKLALYQTFYTDLFCIASRYNLSVLLNTDVMFLHESIISHTRMRHKSLVRILAASIRKAFKLYPMVKGVILRLGESDGIDVYGDFKSSMVIRTVKQTRRLLRALLPLFETYDRLMVIRTWTLGAFQIGDLMWNIDTYLKIFGASAHDNLIVSFKFGETDFFRYQNFNPLFFETPQQKMIELQTRREYEGFGEFPSYVGTVYEKYARYVSLCENVIGITVWCQTGGWSHFTRLTFLNNSSLWNEINTYLTVKIFKEGMTSENAVKEFAETRFPGKNPEALVSLLKLSDRLIKELWYIPEFSSRRMYFRRNRVPPILWIVWDNILINHTLRKILRRFVYQRKEAVHDGYRLLHKINSMKVFAQELGIDEKQFEYCYDTFKIVAVSREYYFGVWSPEIVKRIIAQVDDYRNKYPHGFHVIYDFNPVHIKKWLIKTIFKIGLRSHPHYRLIDKWFLVRFTQLIYPIFHFWQKRRLPDFCRNQAMGIQTLFK